MRLAYLLLLALVATASFADAAKGYNRWTNFVSKVEKGRALRFGVGAPVRADSVQELYFEQRLDHFDAQNNATWQQRCVSLFLIGRASMYCF